MSELESESKLESQSNILNISARRIAKTKPIKKVDKTKSKKVIVMIKPNKRRKIRKRRKLK